MAFQFRQGTEAERTSTGITPESAELIHCTDSGLWYGGDGATAGGNPVPGAIGQHLIDAPTETGGVPHFDASQGRWRSSRISLQAVEIAADVVPQQGEALVWDDAEGAYVPAWPAPEGAAPIGYRADAAGNPPVRGKLGTLAIVNDVDDVVTLHFCATGGATATWERLAFESDLP